jgi:hypothetical protein
MVNHFKGTAWGKWSSLVGTVSSDPSCTSDGAGKVLCAATATKGNLQVAIFNGTLFRAQLRRTHDGTSAMRRTKLHGRIGLVRLQRYFLEQVRQPRDFRRLRSGMCHRQRGRRSDLCGVHDWRCHAGEPLRRRGLGWVPQNLGGIAAGAPDCTSMNSSGQVVCFGEAYFSQIFGTRFDGGTWAVASWTTYASLGGEVTNNANCTTHAAGQLVCGVIAIDNAFYADVYNGTSWSTWTKTGGTGVGIPACAALGSGQAVCVVMGVNNKLTSVVGP